MAELTVQDISHAGLNTTYAAAAAGGDTFKNSGKEFIHIKNGHTASQDVTADSVAPCNQGFDHNVQVTVPNAEERMIGPFAPGRFGAEVALTYSGVTSLTIAIIRLP